VYKCRNIAKGITLFNRIAVRQVVKCDVYKFPYYDKPIDFVNRFWIDSVHTKIIEIICF